MRVGKTTPRSLKRADKCCMADCLVGDIASIIYNSSDYYILSFAVLDRQAPVKVKGSLHGLVQAMVGTPLKLIGEWKTHSKYGREFMLTTWEPWASTTLQVSRFIQYCVPGGSDGRVVGEIVKRYDMETYGWLTDHPAEVQKETFPDVSQESLDRVVLGWGRMLAQRDMSTLLGSGGLTATEIQMSLARFGMEAKSIILENPYRLMEVGRISFSKVDTLALKLGVVSKDPRRIQGALLWALYEASKQGHLYLGLGDMSMQIGDLMHREHMTPLALGPDPFKSYSDATEVLLEQKSVVLDPNAGLYLPSLYRYERDSAALITAVSMKSDLKVDLQSFLEEYEKAQHIKFSDDQRKTVEMLGQHRVLVIAGLPGTGKTTVLRASVRLFEEAKLSFALMAPTGIAAKRLSTVTGQPASTVHRLLRYDGESWVRNANNRFVVDAIILDEASMLDQELLYRLLSALRPETRLVFVGDDAQLPSVGPGNVLRELLDCDKIPHVRLTKIFRQAAKGEIITNSHRIYSGQLPDLDDKDPKSEFRFIRCSDEHKIAELIVKMAVKLKSQGVNFQVLSPRHDGVVGVIALNELLRDALNPEGPMEWSRGKIKFRKGDRLMIVQNDYKLEVYNGDVGKLSEIGKSNLLVKIHGTGGSLDRDVPFDVDTAMSKLRLAYAITAHKSQGSEFDTIIMPITRSQGQLLQRNLLYTAITRARKRVWLIGEDLAVQRAVENNKVVRRNTIFSKALTASSLLGVDPEHGPVSG